ncbi:MAG TPA: hypothetical protein VHX52_05315 [Steroidobacteraceae bacterium]|jgi:hypothetical protein|nr:hypothetical protein [Steroidobacteraceae bacterium]
MSKRKPAAPPPEASSSEPLRLVRQIDVDLVDTNLSRAVAVLDLIERISDGKDLVDLSVDTLSHAAALAKRLIYDAQQEVANV